MRGGVTLRLAAACTAAALLSGVPATTGAAHAVAGPVAPYNVLALDQTVNGGENGTVVYGLRSVDTVEVMRFDPPNPALVGLEGVRTLIDGTFVSRASVYFYAPTGDDQLVAGTYDVAALADDDHIGVVVGIDSSSCQQTGGTVTVHEISYGEDVWPTSMAVSIDTACGGNSQTHAELRANSAVAFDAIELPFAVDAGRVTVDLSQERSLTYYNAGTSPIEVSGLEFSGPGAPDWKVERTSCGGTIPSGGSCSTAVKVTPSKGGNRDAVLTFVDDTARGRHSVALHVDVVPVQAPVGFAVTALADRNMLTWQPGPGRPAGSYVIIRRTYTPGMWHTAEVSVPGDATSYLDYPQGTDKVYYRVIARPSAATGSSVQPEPTTAEISAATADRELLLIGTDATHAEPTLLAGSTVTGTSLAEADAPAGLTSGLSLSPDGTRVAYVKGTGANAMVWRSATGPNGGTWCLDCGPVVRGTDPVYSPDGKRTALISASGQLLLWSHAIGDDGLPVSGVARAAQPSWYPNGATVVVADAGGGRLRKVALTGTGGRTGVVTPIPGTEGAHHPVVSPDGQQVAFLVPAQGGQALQIAGGHGGNISRAILIDDVRSLSWTPDGKSVLLTRENAVYGSEVVALDQLTWKVTTIFRSFYDLRGAVVRVPDATAPVITTTAPGTTGATAQVKFTVTDNISPAASIYVTCALDGGSARACGPTGWSGAVTTGAHTLTVVALDATRRNRSTSKITFSSDATAPRTTLTSKNLDVISDRTPTFRFTASQAGSTFSCQMDGGTWRACSSSKTWTTLKKGTHTFRVRATDKYGNVDASPVTDRFTVR